MSNTVDARSMVNKLHDLDPLRENIYVKTDDKGHIIDIKGERKPVGLRDRFLQWKTNRKENFRQKKQKALKQKQMSSWRNGPRTTS